MESVGPRVKTSHFQGQTSPRAGKYNILPIFVCYSPLSLKVIQNSNIIFCQKFIQTSLRTYLWIQLVTKAKIIHFQCQTSPDHVNLLFYRFSCAIVLIFFCDSKLWDYFCQNFTRTSIKTLSLELVDHHNQNDQF